MTPEEFLRYVNFERRLAFFLGVLSGAGITLAIMQVRIGSTICFAAVATFAICRIIYLSRRPR